MSLNEENGASSTVFDAGLELIKADFHLHTQKDKEFSYTGEQNDFVKSYIDALKQANIGVGVLTNHNKFDKDEYKAIKKRANREGIFILPGVELTVKEGANGVHTLIVFNPDEWLENGNVLTSIDHQLQQIGNTIQQIQSQSIEFETVMKNLTNRIDSLADEFAEIKREINDESLDVDT